MLSFLGKIKNRIRDTFKKSISFRKKRPYVLIFHSDMIQVKAETETKTETDTDTETDVDVDNANSTPSTKQEIIHEPVSLLFCQEIPSSQIIKDEELLDLLSILRRADIEVDKLRLEPKIEEIIQSIPNTSPIFKVKMRIIYVIIALDIYASLFQEKKRYESVRSKRRFGVFQYNDYILRIDDSPYSFINEQDVNDALSSAGTNTPYVITPFLIYTNIRRDSQNKICECNPFVRACNCKYSDDPIGQMSNRNDGDTGILCLKKMRKDAVSFSVQYYVNKSTPLYDWVKDKMGPYTHTPFSNHQYPFFVHLFYKCAQLFLPLHAAGIVHGDVKPDNLLIHEEDTFDATHYEKCKHFTVYLIDFGLSGIHGKGYGTGGTIPYCHPEFKNIVDMTRPNKYNWRTLKVKHDVWSLGIGFLTLYIYRNYYNYYSRYPNYFFTKTGYVAPLILDVIAHTGYQDLFTKIMTEDCIPIEEVCALIKAIIEKNES